MASHMDGRLHRYNQEQDRSIRSQAVENTVACGNCGTTLIEPPSMPADQRQPCPECGSVSRRYEVQDAVGVAFGVTSTVTFITYPQALLAIARSLIDQGYFNIAIVTSHMTC